MTEEKKISYDCVSEFAGHQSNTEVVLETAAKDIFFKVKEKAMQCAVGGSFINFETIKELEEKLWEANVNNVSIKVFDEIIGG
jgi:hypothetical protein